jgi:serine/threonine-protein kinase RsbW
MTEEHRFHLAVGSRFENIELVQVVLRDYLERLGMEEDARHWVDLAVREALANAIKHGNAEDPSKQVQVDLEVEGEDVVIRVEDEGAGFDPAQVVDPLAPGNILKTNGRGILFMEKFMDEIHYGAGPGGGTRVTLRKRLTGSKADPGTNQGGGN